MSDRERIIQLLDEVPAYKLGYVLAYVQGLTADEDADLTASNFISIISTTRSGARLTPRTRSARNSALLYELYDPV